MRVTTRVAKILTGAATKVMDLPRRVDSVAPSTFSDDTGPKGSVDGKVWDHQGEGTRLAVARVTYLSVQMDPRPEMKAPSSERFGVRLHLTNVPAPIPRDPSANPSAALRPQTDGHLRWCAEPTEDRGPRIGARGAGSPRFVREPTPRRGHTYDGYGEEACRGWHGTWAVHISSNFRSMTVRLGASDGSLMVATNLSRYPRILLAAAAWEGVLTCTCTSHIHVLIMPRMLSHLAKVGTHKYTGAFRVTIMHRYRELQIHSYRSLHILSFCNCVVDFCLLYSWHTQITPCISGTILRMWDDELIDPSSLSQSKLGPSRIYVYLWLGVWWWALTRMVFDPSRKNFLACRSRCSTSRLKCQVIQIKLYRQNYEHDDEQDIDVLHQEAT